MILIGSLTDSGSTNSTPSVTDMSSTEDEVLSLANEVHVGLNDGHLSRRRRRLLDLMNRLRSTGAQLDIDLPQIAVLGGQSAGKSSLIEAISGITLPRASGTCTRCATECRLSYSKDPWKCDVYLRYIVDEQDKPLAQIQDIEFGSTICDPSEVEGRLRNAQLAILNPSTPYDHFVDSTTTSGLDSQLTFSKNYISIHISGPDLADLSFCDLPGLIATVTRTGHQGDIQLVESLLKSYIEKPSCLILLTVTCETDFETQGAYTLASKYDPEGKRTIGVLTKPDRIPTGDEVNWIDFIKNEAEPLQHGWFCVKQPDSQQLKQGTTWEQARANEATFFSDWVNKHPSLIEVRSQLGTQNLVTSLSDILSELIAKRLPEIQDEIQNLLEETENKYEKLPKAMTGHPLTEMLGLIDDFKTSVDELIEGDPDDSEGLMQTIHRKHQQLRDVVRQHAPDFRPYDASYPVFLPSFGFLQAEGDSATDYKKNKTGVYIGTVKRRIANARTRELPGYVPYRVTQALIETSIVQWKNHASLLLQGVRETVVASCQNIINQHFSQFEHTGLLNIVKTIVLDHIKGKLNDAEKHIDWLFSLEEEPFTVSTQIQTYKSNFLQAYCDAKKLAEEAYAKRGSPCASPGPVGSQDGQHMEGKPLGSDEEALEIMANVRAYYQVSFKRFVDNVALAIDRDLVRGIAKGIRTLLRNKLMSGEGTLTLDGAARCAELLKEQPMVTVRRVDLQRKLDRLNAAKQELMQIF